MAKILDQLALQNWMMRFGATAVILAGSFFLSAQLFLAASEHYRSEPLAETGFERARLVGNQYQPSGDDDHRSLMIVLDIPGVTVPDWADQEELDLSSDTEVVGVEVDDKAYAFVLEALSDRSTHIVNTLANDRPLTVTYCNKSECVRVLTSSKSSRPIDLHVGGMDIEGEMVVMLANTRYTQSSEKLPLDDMPFERTTYADWQARHPATVVFNGGEKVH